jgi:2C-methyl-D-erythritol 2,4-cyclodiphosphate synthase
MSISVRNQIIEEMAASPPDRAAVLDDIRTLIVTQAPLLESVERTLADGYACALAIEAQRLRLQRQLEEAAGALGESSGTQVISVVAGLAQGVAQADVELAELRTALAGLADKARAMRAA